MTKKQAIIEILHSLDPGLGEILVYEAAQRIVVGVRMRDGQPAGEERLTRLTDALKNEVPPTVWIDVADMAAPVGVWMASSGPRQSPPSKYAGRECPCGIASEKCEYHRG